MNAEFTKIAQLYQNQLGRNLTHQQRVTRLYRAGLKALISWSCDREIFMVEAEQLRGRFDAVKGKEAGKAALLQGEEELFAYTHPDGYVMPYMPGGSKFMRNPPPPLEVTYPDGDAPEEARTGTNTPVWPDMVPITFRKPEEVTSYLIDFNLKRMK